MVVVNFPKAVVDDLKPIAGLGEDVFASFVRLAVDNLLSGVVANPNQQRAKYSKAADALGLPVNVIMNGVSSIGGMLCECVRRCSNEDEAKQSFVDTPNLSAPNANTLLSFYINNHPNLRQIIQETSLTLPRFSSFDWRLEVIIGSRALKSQARPQYLLQLNTIQTINNSDSLTEPSSSSDSFSSSKPQPQPDTSATNPLDNTEVKSQLLTCDYATLQHIHDELEKVVKEVNSKHFRRVMRYVK